MTLQRGRFLLVVIGLAIWAAAAWARLAQVQVLQHDHWHSEAVRQQEREISVDRPRGDIRTRDGRLLAGSVHRVGVYVIPRQIPSSRWREVAESLAPITELEEDEILRRLGERRKFFYLGKDYDPEIAPSVIRLHVRGVGTLPVERRVYPHGALAGPIIGHVDAEGRGQAGLERSYQNTLAGSPGVFRQIRDGKRLPTPLELRPEDAGRPGLSLTLTLDSRIQALVEEELFRTMTALGATGAAGVIMDPGSGEILALASLPAYDPGALGLTEARLRRNRAVEDALEPGSSFKPFILAAALEQGVLSPSETIDCSGGGIQIGNTFIRDNGRYGLLPVRQMLAVSSNVGAIRVAHRVPPEALETTIRGLGFGRRTGVGLPAESNGIFRPTIQWSTLSRAGLAIGQEISASAVQMARAYAAIANGGRLVTPTLVRESRSLAGAATVLTRPDAGEQVLSPEVAAALRDLLEFAVAEGTGRKAHLAGYRMAGKTGTAQRAQVGGYRKGHHAAWFAGFFPAHQPQIVIVLYIEQPRTAFWASEIAAPVARRIADQLVTVLGLLPAEGRTV